LIGLHPIESNAMRDKVEHLRVEVNAVFLVAVR